MTRAERIRRLEAEVDALREEMRQALAGMGHVFEAGREYERSTAGPRPVSPHLRVVR